MHGYYKYIIHIHNNIGNAESFRMSVLQQQVLPHVHFPQVDLALDVEKVVPDFIRRRFMVKCEKIAPNRSTVNPFKRLAAAEAGDLTSESISKALDPEVVSIIFYCNSEKVGKY